MLRLVALLLLAGPAPFVLGQTASEVARVEHDPEVALRRALLLPGGGQFYNRQPVKAGLFYAGAGGIAALFVHNNRQYRHFQRVFRYAERPDEYPQYADESAPYASLIASGGQNRLRTARENARRNRDLSAIGGGVWYALSVLDAYVSAHLIDFDTDESLSLRLAPTPDGLALRVSLSLP